ncbi:MAG: hypothetical protein GC202_00030 [Alphaproteobacteria bacterium]|nr:hypothetical protein [Alphaproteobacteria bacterium]
MNIGRILAVCMGCLFANAAAAQTFTFGLWGDMPYEKAGDAPKMKALLESIGASDIEFSIYDGDIKDGSSKCTDDVFANALKMFGSVRQPVVYVPGDNEWTDCHRLNNGGYDNLERLAYLRKTMFTDDSRLANAGLRIERQGRPGEKFVENVRFMHKGIVFVGLNIPGSNNNRILGEKDCSNKSARTPAQCEADNAEYLERDAANVEWMRKSFEMASAAKAHGIVLVLQADPGFDLPETEDLDESKDPQVSGYRNFMDRLASETAGYSGQVLFVHGDTHFFKVDKPLYSPTKLLPNFTRLQTFGSPSIHWVRVEVRPDLEEVFVVHPVIVRQP